MTGRNAVIASGCHRKRQNFCAGCALHEALIHLPFEHSASSAVEGRRTDDRALSRSPISQMFQQQARLGPRRNGRFAAGGGLSTVGYRLPKADIGVRGVDGSFVAAGGDQICPWSDDTARRLSPLIGNEYDSRRQGSRCWFIRSPAGGSGGIVRASGESRPCSGGSRRRTSLRDSAPRGRSPASGSRSAPTGARRKRSARRSRWQGRHR